MTPDLCETLYDPTTKQGQNILEGLGEILCLDALTNNVSFFFFSKQWDRMPLVHENEGNFNNVMVQLGSGAIAIDNSITCIKRHISGNENFQYNKYIDKIEGLLDSLKKSNKEGVECEQMKVFREKLFFGTGIKLEKEAGVIIQKGYLFCVFMIFVFSPFFS